MTNIRPYSCNSIYMTPTAPPTTNCPAHNDSPIAKRTIGLNFCSRKSFSSQEIVDDVNYGHNKHY